MPIYTYECKKCDIVVEQMIPLRDADKKVECEQCGNLMEKLISTSNFIVNGYSAKNKYGSTDKSRRK